jgi:hypothetical protein
MPHLNEQNTDHSNVSYVKEATTTTTAQHFACTAVSDQLNSKHTSHQQKHIHSPSTCRGTIFAQSASAKFTREQCRASCTNDFSTIITLIHIIAIPTIKGITSIADSYFMICLILVTPVANIANIGRAFVTSHLNVGRDTLTMQARVRVLLENKVTAVTIVVMVMSVIAA